METRSLQIDVKGPHAEDGKIIEFNLIVDGRTCLCFTSKENYEALMYDGFFIRDGKTRDSANILNTSRLYKEVEQK